MIDIDLATLHRRPIGEAGPDTSVRLAMTINGDKYTSYLLEEWEELEDDSGVRGLLFTQRDDEDDESPYPTQEEMNAEDARELYRLTDWLRENREDTRLAGEFAVDWAIRLLTKVREP